MPNVETPALRDWYVLCVFLALIAVLLWGAEFWYKHHTTRAEDSRKFVHWVTGMFMLASPFLFRSSLPLFLLSGAFILVNLLALRFGLFPSILSTQRRSWGTVFYPLAFFVLIALFWQRDLLALLVGMSLLAIADVCAAFVGDRAPSPHRLPLPGDSKSRQGTVAMFISSAVLIAAGILCFGAQQGFQPTWAMLGVIALALAALAAVAEALSWRGSDNLSVALVGAGAMHFLANASAAAAQQFLWGEALALLVAAAAYRVRFLDLSGALMTFMLGTLIFGLGGWAFSLPILAFFVLSSVFSRMGTGRKQEANENFQKSHRRDFGQVLANGGVPGLLVLLWQLTRRPVFYLIYLGAVAAATADTWATEIGLLTQRPPRLITSGQVVARGTSGAVSSLGLLGAALGAAVIAIIGWAVQRGNAIYAFDGWGVLLLTGGGVMASLCDSLLGATLQAQQTCAVCHKVSEKKGFCCGAARQHHSGLRWMDNDVVNGMCGLSGACFALLGTKLA